MATKPSPCKRLRKGNSNKSKVDGGILQRNNIHLAVCEPGRVTDTLQQLSDAPETAKQKVKFLLATDGEELQAEDLTSGDTLACAFSDLDEHFTFFFELAGISTVKEIKESAFDIKATSRLNKLYLELLRHNPDWATAERREEMNHFMARLIFCFFAEDTNIFRGDNLFTDTVEKMSAPDGSNVHEIIEECFRSMDTNYTDKDKADIRVWARSFPYVNGQLFSGSRECPRFTKIGRVYLQHVGKLNWKQINPDIFGSMIQAVADEEERSSLGMHYTSVPNILKVLNPLFLDELREQLAAAGDNARKLLNLRKRIARIRVFDPACGSGNFLVIAYKQLREIEEEVNKGRGEAGRNSDIPITNFRGIELKGFSAEIARLALIIAEYQCDVIYRGEEIALAAVLPLDSQNWITCGNALRLNWLTVCPPPDEREVELQGNTLFDATTDQAKVVFENDGGEVFICGNPPYRGSKWQSKDQKSDLKLAWHKYPTLSKKTDYVTGWLAKAQEYLNNVHNCKFAFVMTNSVVQGQQAGDLWEPLFNSGIKINFARQSFKWHNLASNKAGVTVVIVGATMMDTSACYLYDDDTVRIAQSIGCFLIPNQSVTVRTQKHPISELQEMVFGNMPRDGGFLILEKNEVDSVDNYTKSLNAIYKYIGSYELITGRTRYCLWIEDDKLEFAQKSEFISNRLEKVSSSRLESKAPSTRKYADTPHKFVQRAGKANDFTIAIPRVSSELRDFLPVGILQSNTIISDRIFGLFDAPLWNLALIASRLHWVWIGTVCVRMRTDFSYSNTLGWNTFPLPQLTTKNKADLTACAEEILLARERHFPATIADLYAPDKMPEDLQRAHDRNDDVYPNPRQLMTEI